MPCLQPFLDEPPEMFFPFNVAVSCRDYNSGVHFYIDDYQFERVWQQPERYPQLLERFRCVVAPDFSQYADMPRAMRVWQSYRGKALAAWWQKEGVRVIPNATWSTPDSFSYCFEGIPTDSVVAVNCMGIRSSPLSMYFWRLGYEEMFRRLRPRLILRYGDMMPGEREDISVYYPNEYIKRLKEYGRKR
ncbi:MAG: DUF4417 domain-containing protein [Bacteroidaceae bacterium]|nr:DUF4417 domain-containing protein [Bacteroidaceae bacterium]